MMRSLKSIWHGKIELQKRRLEVVLSSSESSRTKPYDEVDDVMSFSALDVVELGVDVVSARRSSKQMGAVVVVWMWALDVAEIKVLSSLSSSSSLLASRYCWK